MTQTKPWLPDRVVAPEAALACIRRHLPDATHVTPFGAGWDNSAWRVEAREAWVFRFPRRTVAVPLLACEIAVLASLAEHLPIAITTPVFHGVDADGWPYAGYRMLHGDVLAWQGDALAHEVGIGAALGRFVRALQAVTPLAERSVAAPPALAALGPDVVGKVLPARHLARLRERVPVDGVSMARVDALVEAALAASQERRPPRVCVHGDLDGRHVLVEDDGAGHRVSGIIDWGDVHIGDPATDLALAWSALAGEGRAAFFEAYGEVPGGDDTRALARFRALYVALGVRASADDQGDARGVAAAMRTLLRVVAEDD